VDVNKQSSERDQGVPTEFGYALPTERDHTVPTGRYHALPTVRDHAVPADHRQTRLYSIRIKELLLHIRYASDNGQAERNFHITD
jgi:hypothetical protein